MKVAAAKVTNFLGELKNMLYQITEAIRIGDDGYQNYCIEYIDTIAKTIDNFQVEQLIPVTHSKDLYARGKYAYDRMREVGTGGLSYQESIEMYKFRLYNFIKSKLKELTELSAVKNDQLSGHLEAHIIIGSSYERNFYSNEFHFTSIHVMDDVVKEIIAYRDKQPQLVLL